MLPAQLPGHVEAIPFGEHHVENHQIVDAQGGILCPGLAVVDGVHREALCLQQCRDGISQPPLILYHQNPQNIRPLKNHGAIIPEIPAPINQPPSAPHPACPRP